jgi:starch-binding outer membrane protein, SusD/RagB family
MRNFIKIFLVILSITLLSCEKLISPKSDNVLTQDQMLVTCIKTEGILLKAYIALPDDYTFSTDVASDDAVSNDPLSAYRSMAQGSWQASNNAISMWNSSYENIYYINKFLSVYNNVVWSTDPNLTSDVNTRRNILHKKRLKGESYALRGFYKWLLLQYHGGMADDGQLLGFPIVDNYITSDANWALPRNTVAQCVASIFTDLDSAIANLPKTWVDLPAGGVNGDINATSGARFQNRINGNTALAIKARVALLAASPAFSAASGVTWAKAASVAGPLVKDLGGATGLYANGVVFYLEKANKEIIWNRSVVQKRTWEQNNFPPSLFGYGRTNPTQNLIDAFGMKNGYPIANGSSTYNPATPYTNRDPRLNNYIIYNNAVFKSPNVIKTYIGAPNDGINNLFTSTRTGYYLKKFMIESVKLDPGSSVNAEHTYTLVRMTELYLNYAEAANEAWGPDADPNAYGFTARQIIANIRIRAGITQPDAYLATITDAAGLRNLIYNERRIELCFEGFRFWDIRRRNELSTMKTAANAAYITNNAGVYSYVYSNIEERKYTDNMIYGPIPYSETVKYNLVQNKGW